VKQDFKIIEHQDIVSMDENLVCEPAVEEVVETETITIATADGQMVRMYPVEGYDDNGQECNKLPNLDRLDAIEGIEHDDNEYSEHLEGIIVESEEGRERVVNTSRISSRLSSRVLGVGIMI
jgi:hypothetical protein